MRRRRTVRPRRRATARSGHAGPCSGQWHPVVGRHGDGAGIAGLGTAAAATGSRDTAYPGTLSSSQTSATATATAAPSAPRPGSRWSATSTPHRHGTAVATSERRDTWRTLQAQPPQPVRDVVGACRSATSRPARVPGDDHEAGVDGRDEGDQEQLGEPASRHRRARRSTRTVDGDDEADEQRTGVAHEHAGGRPVVARGSPGIPRTGDSRSSARPGLAGQVGRPGEEPATSTAATVAAAPSMLSSRLNELVITTIHSTVTTGSSQPPNTSMRPPDTTTAVAARPSTSSRDEGDSGSDVVDRGRATATHDARGGDHAPRAFPSAGATHAAGGERADGDRRRRRGTGVGRVCALRRPGRSVNPYRRASRAQRLAEHVGQHQGGERRRPSPDRDGRVTRRPARHRRRSPARCAGAGTAAGQLGRACAMVSASTSSRRAARCPAGQRAELGGVGDPPAHVLEARAVRLVVGDQLDLGAAAGALDDRLGERPGC